MAEIAVVVVIVTLVAFGLTALARLWAGDARRREVVADRELGPVEAATGRCGACGGEGWRWEPSAGAGAGRSVQTCWRCRGSGQPP